MRNREQASAGGWAQPVQIGALVTVVIVSVILLGLASSQGKRMSALERNVKTVRDEIGRLAEGSGHANVEVELAELKVSVRKLRTRVSSLDRKVAAVERDRPGEGLAESVADLTKIVRELSDQLAEVRRIAEKAAEKPPEPAAAAAKPDASAEDIAALSDRLAKIERGAAELEKLFRKVSDGSSRVRVNEEALKKVVQELVGDEVREAFEEMRNRWRQGGRQGGRRQPDGN